jgi:hypothetical protein
MIYYSYVTDIHYKARLYVGKSDLIRLDKIRSFYLSLAGWIIVSEKQAYKAVELARERLEARAEQ